MQRQPEWVSRKSSQPLLDLLERGAQTQLTINDDDEQEPKIRVLRTCQTVIQIDYDLSYEAAITRLEYAPIKEILKEALAIIDLPKKNVLQFNFDTNNESIKISEISQKSLIRNKGGSIVISNNLVNKVEKIRKDAEVQTKIRASPHILDTDDVAFIIFDENEQTDISCDPDETDTNVVQNLINPNLKKEVNSRVGYEKGKDLNDIDGAVQQNIVVLNERQDLTHRNVEEDNDHNEKSFPTDDSYKLDHSEYNNKGASSDKIAIVNSTSDVIPNKKELSSDYKYKEDSPKILGQYLQIDTVKENPVNSIRKEDNKSIDDLTNRINEDITINKKEIDTNQYQIINEIPQENLAKSKMSHEESNPSSSPPKKIFNTEISDSKHIEENSPIRIPKIFNNLDPTYDNVPVDYSKDPPFIDSSKLIDLRESAYSTVKPTSAITLLEPSATENHIKNILDLTIESLENMLGRMFDTVRKPSRKAVNKCLQSNFFRNHIPVIGDVSKIQITDIVCECQLGGPGGGAVPKLGPPPLKKKTSSTNSSSKTCLRSTTSILSEAILIANSVSLCKICNKSKICKSAPDLSEHHIRLPLIKSKPCHCVKSDFLHKYAGFMAGKKITKSQTFALLVDEDGEYTDGYLEFLYNDQVGIQTEEVSSEEDLAPCQVPKLKRCSCNRNVEMPWDLITYKPYEKINKIDIKQGEQICADTEEEENICDEDSSSFHLRKLTVAKLREEELIRLTKDRVGTLAIDDFTLGDLNFVSQDDEIDRKLPKEIKEEPKKKFVELPKPKPFQVFSPTCERHNEPYMDRMFTYFPDGCDDLLDPCSSTVEMPWDKIILPQNCVIRRKYKPTKKPNKDDLKKKCSRCNCVTKKATNQDFNFKISFAELSSTIFKNDQVIKSTFSNVTFQPKRAPKINMVQSSFSQPDIKVKKKVNKDCKKKPSVVSSGESKEINVQACERENKCRRPHTPDKNKGKHNKDRSERVANIVNSCKKEMEPLRDGINQLKARIKELNLPDYRELRNRTSFSYISSYSMLTAPPVRPDLYPIPYWGSYFPFCPQYTMPCPIYPSRREMFLSRPPPNRSNSRTDYHSEIDECIPCRKETEADVNDCNQNGPTTSRQTSSAPKKQPSRIPKLCKKRNPCDRVIPESLISKDIVEQKQSTHGTLTEKNCVSECNPQKNPGNVKEEDTEKQCTLCTLEDKFIKTCEAVKKENIECKSSIVSITKIFVRSKVNISLNTSNKYKHKKVDKSCGFKGVNKDDPDQKSDK